MRKSRLTASMVPILVVLGLLVCNQATAAPAPEKVFKWKLQTHMLPGQPHYDLGLSTMLPRVIKERTGGRIEITAYPSGALVPVPEMLNALGAGMFEMVVTAPSYWRGFLPVADVEGGLPASWRDVMDPYNLFWDEGMEKEILIPAYEKHKVRYVTVMPGSVITLFTTKPITKAADFKGMKLRGFGGFMDLLTSLGASAVYIPHGEIYTALALGTVDGAMSSPLAYYGIKLYEQVKYIVQPNFIGNYNDHMLVNMNAWNSLPEDLRQTFLAAAREVSWNYGRLQVAEEMKAMRGFQEKGSRISVVEDWNQNVVPKAAELWKKAAEKDAVSAKAVDMMMKYFKKVGYIK